MACLGHQKNFLVAIAPMAAVVALVAMVAMTAVAAVAAVAAGAPVAARAPVAPGLCAWQLVCAHGSWSVHGLPQFANAIV